MLNIHLDKKEIERFGMLAEYHLPFATARALTWTAKDAQTKVRGELPKRFTIRNSWVSRGIQIVPAKLHNLEAEVGSRDKFMKRQEEGGTRYPLGKHIAIPAGVKGSKKAKIKPQDRPKALLAAGVYNSTRRRENRVFLVNEKTPPRYRHNLPIGIYAAQPNQKGTSKKGQGLTMLYALERKAEIDKRFGFKQTAKAVVNDRFDRLFKLSLKLAVEGN